MSDEFERYALYWVPQRGDALARFGSAWTGWCAEMGEPRARGKFRGLTVDLTTITRESWCHGIHAVIREPFRLSANRSRFSLEHELGALADSTVSIPLPRLRLAVVDGRVSLMPRQGSSAIAALIARTDAALAALASPDARQGFAEATAAERFVVNGSASLAQLPASDEHRFHMPLTDPLGPDIAFKVLSEVQPLLEPMLDEPRHLQDIALMGDPGGGRPLRVLQRYELRESPVRRASHALPCAGPHVLAPMLSDPLTKPDIAI